MRGVIGSIQQRWPAPLNYDDTAMKDTSSSDLSGDTGILRFTSAAEHLGIPEATLRDLRFRSRSRHTASGRVIPGNGFEPAFLTLGRALYVDIPAFLAAWRRQQSGGDLHG